MQGTIIRRPAFLMCNDLLFAKQDIHEAVLRVKTSLSIIRLWFCGRFDII